MPPIELSTYTANVAHFLTALGSTAGSVADALRLFGVTGQHHGGQHPITNAVRFWFPNSPILFCEPATLLVGPIGQPALARIPLPYAVQDFAEDFAAGDYPDLVASARDGEWAVKA